MAKEKRTGKKVTVATPVGDLKGEETLAHYNTIQMEEIRSTMRQVIESVETSNGQVRREMGEFRTEVNGRFELLGKAMRTTNEKIDAVDKKLTEKIDAVDMRLTGVETRLSKKIDKIAAVTDDHEVRIGALERGAA